LPLKPPPVQPNHKDEAMTSYRKLYTPLTVAVLAIGLALAGCASPDTRPAGDQQVQAAQATLSNFERDPDMTWFRDNVKNARAVIISPRVTRAAFIFGGSGGEAVVLGRDGKAGRWVGPAFYNMGAGSVGFQIGVDVSEVIVLVMTEKALDALLSPSFKFGGDASIAAGPVGAGTSATVTTDLVSFARSKGAYAGVSLEGAVIKPDASANSAFYGRAVSPADILVRGSANNAAAAPLQQSLRTIAR
jgi:lipid-binding SYLF domain-containing protein